MPLDYAEKASLALRIVGARFLDDSESSVSSSTAYEFQSARAKIVDGVADARLQVRDCATVASHLGSVAKKLRAIPESSPTGTFDAAADELDRIAKGVCQGDGDGPAYSTADCAQPCTCGVLDLAGIIEGVVREKYARAIDLATPTPEFRYETFLVGLQTPNANLQRTHIGGSTNIRPAPREVRIEIRNCELLGKELCHLAYVVFHELVCHGFQTGQLQSCEKNAHPTCHWSEGWMDALAYEMAMKWVVGPNAGPHPWLPFGGTSAVEHVQTYHHMRYQPDGSLGDVDAKLRRAAREAFRRLVVAFARNGLARSEEEAKCLVAAFSMAANAHAEADCRRLKRLGERFQSLLFAPSLSHRSGEVATACLEFLKNQNISELESALDKCLSS